MPDLTTNIGGLTLRNPVILASGTVGYGTEYGSLIDLSLVGAIVTKTITLNPREGNRPPRLRETPGGLLNSIGLENVGLEKFLDEKLPMAAGLETELIASIAGADAAEFADLASAVGERDEVSAVEINISCPNVKRARRPLWADPEGIGKVVRSARAATQSTLIVKLSPNVADAQSVAEAAEEAGADALVVANTLTGMRIDVDSMTPALGNVFGGLSGRALLPVNLALTWKIAGSVRLPIIGGGGIASADDALEYILAGATAVQVGTALFKDPGVAASIVHGLTERMIRKEWRTTAEYVGLARKEKEPCLAIKADS